ncbi:hypothetical protein D9M68_573810 [compost metagenome]
MPVTPYIGMPALRKKRLSVAPVLMAGTTGTPGHICCVSVSTVFTRSPFSGEAGLRSGLPMLRTTILSLPTAWVSRRSTSSGSSCGRMRQLTVALADCGSAFSAWPACTIVATQVVRSCAL